MSGQRFVTQSGELIPANKKSKHHVFSGGWYRTKEEQDFIASPGLIIHMQNRYHNLGRASLHTNVVHPPKPSRPLREQIAEYAHAVHEGDSYETFCQIARFIGNIAQSSWSPERSDEAFYIHENLMQQSPYIEIGRVEPVYARV